MREALAGRRMKRTSALFLVVVQAMSCLAAYALLRCDDSGPIEELHLVLPLAFAPILLQFFLLLVAAGRSCSRRLTTYAVVSVIICFLINQVLVLFWVRWQGVGEGVIAISAFFAIHCIVCAALFLGGVTARIVSHCRKRKPDGNREAGATAAC